LTAFGFLLLLPTAVGWSWGYAPQTAVTFFSAKKETHGGFR